jgi:hypothetical protein
MRSDIRIRVIDLIKQYMNENETEEVNYKDFMKHLKDNNELLMRIHVLDDKYMFGSLLEESKQ